MAFDSIQTLDNAPKMVDSNHALTTRWAHRIHILVANTHPVFAAGLNTIIGAESDMSVISQDAPMIESLQRHSPDVVVMDKDLTPDIEALLSLIRSECPRTRVVLLTTVDGGFTMSRAARTRASAYILKSASREDLIKIIRLVHGGRKYIPPEINSRLTENLGEEELTSRELDVLRLIGAGNRNKQIAGLLSIAETTVRFHTKNLVEKLRANDRAHAVAIAMRRRLLEV